MKVVVDTSVLFQALHSSSGAAHAILGLMRDGALKLSLSIPVFEEYCDVLLRKNSLKQFGMEKDDVLKILDFIAFAGIRTDIRFLLRPNLRDENDNIFIELAFASDAKYIITKNVRDFTCDSELSFDDIPVVTPADFMQRWRKYHG